MCMMSFKKETPLANAAFWAARKGNLALLQLLLNSGRVDVDCRDSELRIIMTSHCCSPTGLVSILPVVFYRQPVVGGACWAPPIALLCVQAGTTALMVASFGGHTQCVRELVLHGADINLQRESGATALFFAAQQGHDDIVKFLFEFGASTEFITRWVTMQEHIWETLTKYGLLIQDGGTALLAACQHGHTKVVETLLKNGANIHDQLFDGATSLFLAAQGGYVDVIRLLLTYGAKANQPRQDGTTALWIAAQLGYSEAVRVLLLRGADRDASRIDGTSALFKAAAKGFSDVIEELLKFSPTLGVLKNGSTALHAAVLGGNIKSVALLLEAGANPSMRNKANELPADLTQNERILRLLRTSETKCIRP